MNPDEVSSRLPSLRCKFNKKIGGSSNENQSKRRTTVHRLDYEGLVQVAELIERLRQERRAYLGENETNCESEEDYDEDRQTQVKGSSEEQR